MCGIFGSINYQISSNKIINLLYHRGPDDYGEFMRNNVHFIHTRLAIQDIKRGKQPLTKDGLAIIFNGEIYNHLELRKIYLSNCHFATNSDTETLLELSRLYGDSMFNYIDGMFAFAIFDIRKNEIFLARDRAGKKPLYYYYDGNKFVFASELNVLKVCLNLEIDYDALEFFLYTGFFWRCTPFRNVYELEPGSYLVLDVSCIKSCFKKKYFQIEDIYCQKARPVQNLGEALICVEENLKKAVHDRVKSSDVEVGAFLSSGIDSSLVVAFAREVKSIKTFTVRFSDGIDESKIAESIAKILGVDNIIIDISMKNLKEEIEKVLLAYGKPFSDSSTIPTYYVSQATSNYLKVILNGDGGDELFAGYRRYVPFGFKKLLLIAKILSKIWKILPAPKKRISIYNFFYRLLKTLYQQNSLNFYISLTTDLFIKPLNKQNKYLLELESYINNIIGRRNLDWIQKLLILDFDIILPSDLLQKMDIATMQHSLEARSPFLSIHTINAAACIPSKYKVKGTVTKYILRELLKKFLPVEIVNLPKRGFEVPLIKWIDHDLREVVLDYLFYNKNQIFTEFYSKKLIQEIYNRKFPIAEDKRAKVLWNLFTLEVWWNNL